MYRTQPSRSLMIVLVQLPAPAVVLQNQGGGHPDAADAGERADLHPHGEVPLVDAAARGAGSAEELDVRRVLLARALRPWRVQGQAR